MQSRRIKVCPVRPHKRVNIRVNSDFIEECEIAQRSIQFAGENGLKVDRLRRLWSSNFTCSV